MATRNYVLVAGLLLLTGWIVAGCGSSSGGPPSIGEGNILVSQALGGTGAVAAERASDQIIVKFREETSEQTRAAVHRSKGATVKRVAPGAFVVLTIPATRSVEDMVAAYQADPNVEWAEPDYTAHAFMSPNDPYFGYQWNFFDYGTRSGTAVSNFGIQAPSAWNTSTGSGVTVAIVDTGVAYENYAGAPGDRFAPYYLAPDLAGATFVPGYDFVNSDTHPNDDNAHGTHVCGTVAQTTNDGYGVAGVAFAAKIMPVKVLDATGSGTYSDVASGIRFAVDNGAKIINMSLGGSVGSQALQDAINYAQSKDVLVVCAAGNNGASSVSYPARYSWCIAVGATRFDGNRAAYSNYGPDLDIVAPGGDTSVDQNGDGYGDGVLQQTFATNQPANFGFWFYQGTSMATPHVSGVAALVWAANPGFTASDVTKALESTAKDLGASGWDRYYGWGLVNAAAAVAGTPTDTQPPVVNITAPASGTTVSGTTTITATASDNVGVSSVRYKIDGAASVPMSSVGSNTYQGSWDSTTTSNGGHTIAVEALDAAGNVGSGQVNVTVSNAQTTHKMHVGSIIMSLQTKGTNTRAVAVVTILDSNGAAVPSATVKGSWSGLTTGTSSGTTNSSGQVTLTSAWLRKPRGTFTFTVASVTQPNYTYDPALNLETSDSISTS